MWVEISYGIVRWHSEAVTPSRVCELKLEEDFAAYFSAKVTPSRVCELKFVRWWHNRIFKVTPSRVCELKFSAFLLLKMYFSHTLTGVWVEILEMLYHNDFKTSHPHGCVSWNAYPVAQSVFQASHPHGCVSWNLMLSEYFPKTAVTPSRVCELKWKHFQDKDSRPGHTLTGVWVEIGRAGYGWIAEGSHPHGCVSWNNNTLSEAADK